MTVRFPVWLLLSFTGCNCILGQEPPRPTLSMCNCIVWVPQGSHVDLPFTVNRTSSGPLTVHATSLPAGVTASDVTLANDESSGALTLSASSTATLGATSAATFELVEAAQIDDEATLTVGVSGVPGTPDTTWGNGGVVTLPLGDCPTANYVVDIDSQGRILAGGTCVESDTVVDLLIARYLPDTGALDTTFGAQHVGYVLPYPGPSVNNEEATYPVGLRVDAQDRIVMANARDDPQQHAIAEVRRWNANGVADTFHIYSDQVNGTGYSGVPSGLVLQPDGQIVLLADWHCDGGLETLLQTLANDGAPESTDHITLVSGTLSSQHFTEMLDVALDDRGGFVLGGRQYDGANWVAGNGPINGAIARVGADGLRDMSFGTNAYVSYDPTFTTIFWHVTIDPTSKDIFAVGADSSETHGSLVRLDGTTGQPSGFGQMTLDACPGGTSQALTQVMVDSRSRIVATGPCAKDGVANIGNARVSFDGALDTHYGSAGGVGLTPGNPRGAKLAADDRLYVVGEIDGAAAVWRFWP